MIEVSIGDRLPQRGNRLTRGFGKLMLRLLGWRLTGTIPDREKLVAIGAPHTTGRDFVIAMLGIQAIGLAVSWLGVDWLFRYPLMRRLGGVAVDRSRSQGLVDTYIEKFKTHEKLILALAPEGSRRKVPWKAGFYHIAHGAGVPILMVSIDQRKKVIEFGPTLFPTGDFDADMAKIRQVYARFLEQHPHRFGMSLG